MCVEIKKSSVITASLYYYYFFSRWIDRCVVTAVVCERDQLGLLWDDGCKRQPDNINSTHGQSHGGDRCGRVWLCLCLIISLSPVCKLLCSGLCSSICYLQQFKWVSKVTITGIVVYIVSRCRYAKKKYYNKSVQIVDMGEKKKKMPGAFILYDSQAVHVQCLLGWEETSLYRCLSTSGSWHMHVRSEQ